MRRTNGQISLKEIIRMDAMQGKCRKKLDQSLGTVIDSPQKHCLAMERDASTEKSFRFFQELRAQLSWMIDVEYDLEGPHLGKKRNEVIAYSLRQDDRRSCA